MRSQFCTWLGNRIIVLHVLWVKVRTNCIIRMTEKISVHKIWIRSSYIITTGLYEHLVCPVKLLFDTSHFVELFEAWKIVQHNFSQFWTVFPSFGREKLGKTGLSQFIPFWTGKTGFGREKPNPLLSRTGENGAEVVRGEWKEQALVWDSAVDRNDLVSRHDGWCRQMRQDAGVSL